MRPLFCLAIATLAAGIIPSAGAGLFEDLYHGLDLLATPLGSPTFASQIGGAQNGQRFGRLRIVPNNAGQGYRLEFDRSFGNDAGGRPEVLDLGAAELELAGSISATAGYTSRWIHIGNLQTSANNLAYTLRGKTGAQDVSLSGTLNMIQNLEVNELGFYTLNLNVANTVSAVSADGVVVNGDEPTNFNLGPISIKGNIFVDGLGAVLAGLGVDTQFISDVFPESPVDRLNAAIRNEAAKQDSELLQQLAAQLNVDPAMIALGPAAALLDPSTLGLDAGVILPESSFPDGVSGSSQDVPAAPEPGTLAGLLAVGLALACRRR